MSIRIISLALMCAFLLACPSNVIRNPSVYANEVEWIDMAMEESTSHMEMFLVEQCLCVPQPHAMCEDVEETYLVLHYRWGWHRDMMLWMGDLLDERPPEVPPVIPDSMERTCE